MSKQYKIYKRTVHEDRGLYISFGIEEDVNSWKLQEQEWIEQDLGVGDDTIEELEITSSDPNIGKILGVINAHIREDDDE